MHTKSNYIFLFVYFKLIKIAIVEIFILKQHFWEKKILSFNTILLEDSSNDFIINNYFHFHQKISNMILIDH